jgi:hypothetical protein
MHESLEIVHMQNVDSALAGAKTDLLKEDLSDSYVVFWRKGDTPASRAR